MRRKKIGLIRRLLLRMVDPSAPKRRRRRRSKWEGVLVVAAIPVAAFVLLRELAKWLIWILAWLFSPKPVGSPINGPSKIKRVSDLRERQDWQREWNRVRSQYVRVLEKLYGDDLWCFICGHPFPKPRGREFTIDHIEAVQRNPERSFDHTNLQPVCRTCNSSKGSRPPRVEERRPAELIRAAKRARAVYLKRHKGVDPIHAMLASHRRDGPGWGILIWNTKRRTR